MTDAELRAFGLGYYHGRAFGAAEDNYLGRDTLRHLYRRGYDAGVADHDPFEVDSFTNRPRTAHD